MKNAILKIWGLVMIWIAIAVMSNLAVYDLESHNCHDMSVELHDGLQSVGIESHYEWAQVSHDAAHIWVVVDLCGVHIPIESTNYAAMPYPEYLRFYFNPDGRFSGDMTPPDHIIVMHS